MMGVFSRLVCVLGQDDPPGGEAAFEGVGERLKVAGLKLESVWQLQGAGNIYGTASRMMQYYSG